MALAYIGIFTTLMLAMLTVVLGQVKPIAQARKDIGSVNAATSGLQAGLTAIRSSVDSTGEGNRGRLPCTAGSTTDFREGVTLATTPGAKLAGVASSLPGRFRYEVSVGYFLTDPTDQSSGWLQANALECPLLQTPRYAYLQSYGVGDALVAGTSGRGNRSQTGVYQFSVPQENIAGGRLRQFGRDHCLDAGDSPGLGTLLHFATCAEVGTPRQLWVYRSDLTLFFGGAPALNLCIQGSATQVPQLQRCTGTGNGSTYPYAPGQQVQLWSFNNDGHFASASDDGNVTGSCVQPETDAAAAQLTFYACTGGTTSFQAFDPDPSVGAGKAGGNTSGVVGEPTNQYVNFEQFGRCLDVTAQMVGSTHLIAYPCKQAPLSSLLTWNQVWTWTSVSGNVGTMRTDAPSGAHCLDAPASGEFIVVKPCTTPVPQQQQWTATGDIPGSPQSSFNLVSASRNQCMSLGPTGATTYGSSKVILEPCNGGLKQRWNAPPPPPTSGLGNIKEGTPARLAGS
jgi:hypothetical protein